MINIKNPLSHLKTTVKNKISTVKNSTQKFKENVSEAKSKPRSKRKSLFLGFTTVLGIFGVTLLVPVLPAIAKDVPKNTPRPGEVCPAPSPQPAVVPSQQIITGLTGAAATVCGLAITSGSFLVGAACGVVVVVGILKAQGK